MLKAELRKICLAKQKRLSTDARNEKSRQIANLFFQSFDLKNMRFLHCFLPIEKFNEIDTLPVFQKIWREFPQITTLVPRVNFQNKEIENLKFTSETKLVKNIWDINEPIQNEAIEGEKIDAVLVPLLSVDAKGFRVGYGKGFYDKFLRNCRADCLKIGLSYFAPVKEISDAQDFDVKLDFLITPEKVWRFA
jgi:5-formyltetrahydrofolate cyclo-ligase